MDKSIKIIEILNYKDVLDYNLSSHNTIVVIGFPNSGKTSTFKNVKETEYVTFVYQGDGILVTKEEKYIIPENKFVIIDEIHSNKQELIVKEIQKNNRIIIIHNRIFSDDTKRSVDSFMKVYHELNYDDCLFFVKIKN